MAPKFPDKFNCKGPGGPQKSKVVAPLTEREPPETPSASTVILIALEVAKQPVTVLKNQPAPKLTNGPTEDTAYSL